jgi:ABC-type nitrate/sulfonate/bicarbonate transport system substrate-binding protein
MRFASDVVASLMAITVLIAFTSVACISSNDTDIRYGGQYYPGEFVLFGNPSIWDLYGLEVDHILFSSGEQGNDALIAGRVTVNVGSDIKTISLFNALPDEALIIGTTQRGDRYATVVRTGTPYTSWHDLKGKTVGICPGTGAEEVVRKYFDREGIEWDDYHWVYLNVEDMNEALSGKTVEAYTAWEPTPAIAESQGTGRILRTYGDVSLVPVCIHTTKEFAQSHREEIIRFLEAHLYKADLIRTNPLGAAQMASDGAASQGIWVSADAFRSVFERIDYTIPVDQEVIDAINETALFMYEAGEIESIPTIEWDNTYIEEAMKRYAEQDE